MFAKDLEIVNVLRTGARQFLNDAFGIAVEEEDAFAFDQLPGGHELLPIIGPERVRVGASDRLLLIFDLKIDQLLRGVLEGSGNEIADAGLVFKRLVDFDDLRPSDAS